jgi:hypothetical protein
MIEDKATEKLKERAKKLGLIVNAGTGKTKPGRAGGSDRTVPVKPDGGTGMKKGNKR